MKWLALGVVLLASCSARPIVRSVVLRGVHTPSHDGFELDHSECVTFCGAPRTGETLLWCHESNLHEDAADAGDGRQRTWSEMALVCNFGTR